MTRNYYKSSSYLYSLSFTVQRTNRVSGRGESPEEESSDTVMPPLCAILVLFSKVYGLLGNIVQPDVLVRAQLGDTVTLPCFHPSKQVTCVSWLKQPLGLKPQLVAIVSKYQPNATFFNEFKNSKRLIVNAEKESFNLTVSQVEPSDSATYYCTVVHFMKMSFGEGTTLMVMGSKLNNRSVVLQQPESESLQPGDSVTLQCTVHTETCAGEHSVYWFRQDSGESPPGIIYTHGTRSDECQRSSGAVSPTQSCVYNFPKRNLSPSDAGTYYCAVATCGEILFGNGIKLDFKGERAVRSTKELHQTTQCREKTCRADSVKMKQ
ncbi:immunoglobulin superfamily member 3-like isoform X2 [Anguilla anguilla]|uniref:immunoglobulin superfamily member 3-like isoform X2 n=1 Tax=Anguilla anguilla TaxID=7936 RepID=UPI0015AC3CE2|nr:immunoglobulin superfamily member 3-like isoform X2 [Anguilla anguilla]